MLSAVPVLADQPLPILWQSTVVDIEPGSRYQYRADAASVNTTLAIMNNTSAALEFPLLLATADPEARDQTHRTVRIGSDEFELEETPLDQEWDTLAQAILAAAQAQGHDTAKIQAYLDHLRPRLARTYRTRRTVRLERIRSGSSGLTTGSGSQRGTACSSSWACSPCPSWPW